MKARRYHLDRAGADQTRQDRMVVRPVVCVRAHYCLLYQPKILLPSQVFNMVAKVKSSSTIRMECGIFMCFYSYKNKLFSRCAETRTLFLIPFNLTGFNSSFFIRNFNLFLCFVNYFSISFTIKFVFSTASSLISAVPRLCSIHVSAGMQRVAPSMVNSGNSL